LDENCWPKKGDLMLIRDVVMKCFYRHRHFDL